MKKINYTISILLLLIAFSTNAQITQTIRGTIVDNDSKEQLFGANVVIRTLDPLVGTTTDFDGSFTLENIPLGKHTVEVSYLGYETVTLTNQDLKGGKQLVLTIGMNENVLKTEEVVIKGKKRQSEAINKIATVSAQEFTIEQTDRYAGTLGDVARMAQNYAGVQGSDDSRNDIVVRGNAPTGVLYRLDGLDIPNPNHFAASGTAGGPVSILNTNNLGNSDFMSSAFPAEYSNALSSVFDLHLKKGNNQKYEFMGQVGFNGFELGAEGPISKKHKSSFIGNYRYSMLGLISAMGVDFGTGSGVPQYQDLNFKLNFPYKKGEISLWGIGGISNIDFLDSKKKDANLYSTSAQDLRFGSNIGAVGLTHVHRFNKKTYFKTILGIDAVSSTTRIERIDTAILKLKDFYGQETLEGKGTLKFVLNHKINSRHLVQAGLSNQLKFYNLEDSVSQLLNDTFNVLTESEGKTLLSQAYIQWQYKISKKLKLNTGLNAQYLALNNSYSVEPRVGLKWQLHDKHSLSFGYGLHSQIQSLQTYFTEREDINGENYTPNKNVGMSKSHHFVLGYNWDFLKDMHLKTEFYYQYLENIPIEKRSSMYSMLNQGSGFGYNAPDTLENTGTGTNYGVELTIEKYLKHGWYVLSTTSLYQSKYIGSDDIERNTAFNGNYTVNLLGGKEFEFNPKKENKKLIHSVLFDVKAVLTGGSRYIPIDVAKSKLAKAAIYDYDRAFEEKHPDYFRLDFNVGYKMNLGKITQEFTFSVQNATNRKNIFSQRYNSEENKIVYNYQRGFFPMGTYRIMF